MLLESEIQLFDNFNLLLFLTMGSSRIEDKQKKVHHNVKIV